MGLDMSLVKVKLHKTKDHPKVTINELITLDYYLSWIEIGRFENYSFYEWSKRTDPIPKELVELYKKDFEISNKENEARSIFSEIMYWRNAYQIHHWFVNHIQNGKNDCRSYEVSECQLKEFLQFIKQLKESLPDESNIEKTITALLNILKNTNFEKEMIIYSSSW